MRLPDNPYLPNDLPGLVRQLNEVYRKIAQQVNGLSEGNAHASYNAATAAPTTGDWYQGDFIANSQPTELGVAGAKYVIRGFRCVASGTPGTWVQERALTGN